MTPADVLKLRGRVAWRHERDRPTDAPFIGTCLARTAWIASEWYVVWSPDALCWLGGGSWTTHLACFTPLDDAAKEILRFVSPRRANQWPSSAWVG